MPNQLINQKNINNFDQNINSLIKLLTFSTLLYLIGQIVHKLLYQNKKNIIKKPKYTFVNANIKLFDLPYNSLFTSDRNLFEIDNTNRLSSSVSSNFKIYNHNFSFRNHFDLLNKQNQKIQLSWFHSQILNKQNKISFQCDILEFNKNRELNKNNLLNQIYYTSFIKSHFNYEFKKSGFLIHWQTYISPTFAREHLIQYQQGELLRTIQQTKLLISVANHHHSCLLKQKIRFNNLNLKFRMNSTYNPFLPQRFLQNYVINVKTNYKNFKFYNSNNITNNQLKFNLGIKKSLNNILVFKDPSLKFFCQFRPFQNPVEQVNGGNNFAANEFNNLVPVLENQTIFKPYLQFETNMWIFKSNTILTYKVNNNHRNVMKPFLAFNMSIDPKRSKTSKSLEVSNKNVATYDNGVLAPLSLVDKNLKKKNNNLLYPNLTSKYDIINYKQNDINSKEGRTVDSNSTYNNKVVQSLPVPNKLYYTPNSSTSYIALGIVITWIIGTILQFILPKIKNN